MASPGDVGAAIGRENREAVRKFFVRCPWGTQKECAAETGLSQVAVGRHVKVLRAEYEAQRQKGAVNG